MNKPMKNAAWRAALVTAVGIGCLGALSVGSVAAETLHIQGAAGFADDVIRPYQQKIETQTGYKLSLTANTSGEGLLALLKGEADLAMISAPLEDMVALLRKLRPDSPFHLLHEFHIGEARVAYPVNPENPVRSLSLAKLKQILSGQIDNWRTIGGPDLPIHVVSLRDGGGSKRTTEAMLLDGQSMTPRSPILVASALDVVQAVEGDRGAFGISEAGLVNLHRLPELQTKVLITQSYNLVSLNEPTDAMRAVIAATRNVVFEEEP
jgi:phosphate transport system substrate-binding protein